MIRLGIYLGIGALMHLLFVGSQFDWNSAHTWLWLFAWPLMMLLWMGVIGIVIGILALAFVGVRHALGHA